MSLNGILGKWSKSYKVQLNKKYGNLFGNSNQKNDLSVYGFKFKNNNNNNNNYNDGFFNNNNNIFGNDGYYIPWKKLN